MRGIPFVVSAPSGAGKSTLIRRVRESVPGLGFSVSHTTRPRRAGEQEAVDYYFVDRPAFEELIGRGAFVEWAEVHGNLYGTSLSALEHSLSSGIDVLLDIDVQGALQVKEKIEGSVLVFLLPPSWEELRRRLEQRGTDEPTVIDRRVQNGARELAEAARYDYLVVNDDAERAALDLASVLRAERCRASRSLRLLERLKQR